MNCKKAQKKLSLYVAGDISSRWKEKIELHLSSCQVCQEELESLKDSLSRIKEEDQYERQLLPDWDERRWAALITEISRTKKETPGEFRQPIRAWKTAAYVFAAGIGVMLMGVLIYYFIHQTKVENNQTQITRVVIKEKKEHPAEKERSSIPASSKPAVDETLAKKAQGPEAQIQKSKKPETEVFSSTERTRQAQVIPEKSLPTPAETADSGTRINQLALNLAQTEPTTGSSQERLEIILQSQESGLKILWVLDKNFDIEGVKK
jgi:hypothetical protein